MYICKSYLQVTALYSAKAHVQGAVTSPSGVGGGWNMALLISQSHGLKPSLCICPPVSTKPYSKD